MIASSNVKLVNKNLQWHFTSETLMYGVMFTIENGKENVDTIKFELNINYVKKINENFIIQINKTSKTYINDEEVNLIAEVTATKVADTLYPLQVCVSPYGKILSIHNYEAIQKRWLNIKQEIKEMYQGEIIDKYLELASLSLQNEDILFQSLSSDYFLSAYFNSLYDNATGSKEIYFPIAGKALPVKYETTILIDDYYTEDNLMKLNIEGTLNDERSMADLENELNYPYYGLLGSVQQATGNYNAKYFLDPYYNTIDTAYVECDIKLTEEKRIKVLIARLNAPEKYLTPEEKQNRKNNAIIEDVQVIQTKKTFWQKIDDKLKNL